MTLYKQGIDLKTALLSIDNLCCSDVGGTSFDVGLITEGEYPINIEPDITKFKLSIPQIIMDSIGAGTGAFVTVDEVTDRIELGPDSASYKIGVCWKDSGLTTPTINDCNCKLYLIMLKRLSCELEEILVLFSKKSLFT